MQSVKLVWYFGAVFLSPLVSGSSNPPEACCTDCACNATESGECFLQFQERCRDGSCVHLDFVDKTSLVEVVMSVGPNWTDPVATELDISEWDHLAERYVHLETIHVNLTEQRYLSRSSRALVCGRSRNDVKLSFKEIQYSRRLKPVSDPFRESGQIVDEILSNSVTLYQLPEDPRVKWRGIEMTIQNPELDTQKGEYILVGAGSPDDFPPRFVTQVTTSFYVANASAYVELVAHDGGDRTFKILWHRKAGELPPELDPVETLNAVLVCFYNVTLAGKEFEEKKDMEEAFPSFREAFAASARDHTQKKYECTKSSIQLLGHPTPIQNSTALSILLVLRCDERTFMYQELRKLMTEFEDKDQNKTLGYKVGLCPAPPYQDLLSDERLWGITIYGLAPAFAIGILLVWACRNRIFQQKCGPEKPEDATLDLETNCVTVEPNTYEATTTQTYPKICLDSGDGRRRTLIPGSPQEPPDGGDPQEATEMLAVPSTSREPDRLVRVLKNRRNKRRASIQALMPQNEEKPEKSQLAKSEGEESDHLYDSVNSNKDLSETKL